MIKIKDITGLVVKLNENIISRSEMVLLKDTVESIRENCRIFHKALAPVVVRYDKRALALAN